jgi:hypothetical protein
MLTLLCVSTHKSLREQKIEREREKERTINVNNLIIVCICFTFNNEDILPVRPATLRQRTLLVLLYEHEDIPKVLFDFRYYMLRQYAPCQLLLQTLMFILSNRSVNYDQFSSFALASFHAFVHLADAKA